MSMAIKETRMTLARVGVGIHVKVMHREMGHRFSAISRRAGRNQRRKVGNESTILRYYHAIIDAPIAD